MPTINNAIQYSDSTLAKITQTTLEPGYNHTRWGDEDLEPVRCEIRDFYRREQRANCAYCREPIGLRAASNSPIEHIAPKSRYLQFMFEPKNLCVVCADCNENKRNREVIDSLITGNPRLSYPKNSARYRIVHPHFDEYSDHIIKAKFLYLERTQKGGHTIYICNLNRFIRDFGVSQEFWSDLEILAERERFHGG
ncbi:HNH endonuclease domain-containing protein [Pseudomonas asgharzadehiana]|uniref:HNH endonuclease domain-containing protein n=1 Tax=Pseudomonas asgharzadehiana TaxID=2842349 RepID=UPI0034D41A8D